MISPVVARRYAAALLEAAWAEGTVELVESDLGLVGYVLESNPELKEALFHPLLPASRKRQIVKGVFEGKISPLTFSYLNLLIDKQREEAILQTEEQFVRLANERRGIVEAKVTSAAPLTDAEMAALKAKLEARTGKTVELSAEVDASLIGGALVRIGDRIVDGTVKGYLDRLREQLIGRVEPGSVES